MSHYHLTIKTHSPFKQVRWMNCISENVTWSCIGSSVSGGYWDECFKIIMSVLIWLHYSHPKDTLLTCSYRELTVQTQSHNFNTLCIHTHVSHLFLCYRLPEQVCMFSLSWANIHVHLRLTQQWYQVSWMQWYNYMLINNRLGGSQWQVNCHTEYWVGSYCR